jgi:hypothetical protein
MGKWECGIKKNWEVGMGNAELKRMGKWECGIKKNWEVGMGNAELKRIGNRKEWGSGNAECGEPGK